jgi:hypothetical protein
MKKHILLCLLTAGSWLSSAQDARSNRDMGPLRVCAANSRYFKTLFAGDAALHLRAKTGATNSPIWSGFFSRLAEAIAL